MFVDRTPRSVYCVDAGTRRVRASIVRFSSRSYPLSSLQSVHIMCALILGSSNVMSSMSHRRPSGAKLHSLAVEAPMTKVINIILAAQENSPLYIAQALDKVYFWRTDCLLRLHSYRHRKQQLYRASHVLVDWVLLTWIWDVPPPCLGSR